MKKYFILFCVPAAVAQEWNTTVPPEQMKAEGEKMMHEWLAWMKDHEGAIQDKGQPLGKTKRVTQKGVEDVRNDLNYYIIVEAESHEAAAEMMKDNPHYRIPEAYIEVMEISRSGM